MILKDVLPVRMVGWSRSRGRWAGMSRNFCISALCNTLTLGLLSVQHVEEIFKKQNPVWKCEKGLFQKRKKENIKTIS